MKNYITNETIIKMMIQKVDLGDQVGNINKSKLYWHFFIYYNFKNKKLLRFKLIIYIYYDINLNREEKLLLDFLYTFLL